MISKCLWKIFMSAECQVTIITTLLWALPPYLCGVFLLTFIPAWYWATEYLASVILESNTLSECLYPIHSSSLWSHVHFNTNCWFATYPLILPYPSDIFISLFFISSYNFFVFLASFASILQPFLRQLSSFHMHLVW